MSIRPATEQDADQIWEIFHEVVARGDSYVYPPDISKDKALDLWMGAGCHCYVYEDEENQIFGTYRLMDNQMGQGAHVANGSFMVAKAARGKGLGHKLGAHAIEEASRLGYQAMQFNMVVATNKGAIKLWQKLGFTIIGTLPKVFNHSSEGLVDAHIMHRFL